ncbi:phage tail tape measure protein [Paraburkholderia sediminicola]|nr:phage tail tape measure protein [Paraburkholderia sediminicola]
MQSILAGIEAFKAGDASNTVVASLQQLGVKATDASGRMHPMKEILLDLSAAFRKMPNRQDQMLWSQRLVLDEGALNLLRQGRGAVQDLYDRHYRNSKVTEASASQAEDTRKAWTELGNTWEDIKNTLFADLTPAMKVLNSVLREMGKLMEAHPGLTAGVFGTLMAASTFGGILKLTGALGGLRTILGAVGRLLGLGGAAATAAGETAATGAATAAGDGLLATLGTAGLLAWIGLKGAEAAGLPDTDVAKGQADVKCGEWLKASADLPLTDFVKTVWNHVTGGGKPLVDASKAQQDAAHALVDAAKQLANAVSSAAEATEVSPAASGVLASERTRYAVASLMKMGWSKEQAAGLAANLNFESGLRPNIVGDSGAAYGIGQWHADRQAEFKRAFGHDMRGSTLDEQLQFVHYELTRGRDGADAGRRKPRGLCRWRDGEQQQ